MPSSDHSLAWRRLLRIAVLALVLWATGAVGWGPGGVGRATNAAVGAQSDAEVTGSTDWQEYVTGARRLRIGLVTGANEIQLVANGCFRVSQRGTSTECRECDVFTAADVTPDPVRLTPERGVAWTVRVNGKPFPGRYIGPMELFTAPGTTDGRPRLTLVNEPPFEQYIAGVVAKEALSSFRMEALRAQAIAARSYTLRYLGRHQAEGFDLCASTDCQGFQGVVDPLSRVRTATHSTRGQVLVYNGQPIKALYSSTCGGETASGDTVSLGSADCPYLAGCCDEPTPRPRLSGEAAIQARLAEHSTAYCKIAPEGVYRWTKTLTAAEVNAFVAANLGKLIGQPDLKPGKVKSLRVSSRSGGRAQTLELACENGIYEVMGNDIRWLLGKGKPDGLRSTFFTVKTAADPQGVPVSYTFTGGGWGHGVGMCQYGAEGRARAGQCAAEILAAYYPGTKLWTADLTDESEE